LPAVEGLLPRFRGVMCCPAFGGQRSCFGWDVVGHPTRGWTLLHLAAGLAATMPGHVGARAGGEAHPAGARHAPRTRRHRHQDGLCSLHHRPSPSRTAPNSLGERGFGRVFLLHPSGFGACFGQVLSTPSGVGLLCVLPSVACILFAKVVAENRVLREALAGAQQAMRNAQDTLGGGGQEHDQQESGSDSDSEGGVQQAGSWGKGCKAAGLAAPLRGGSRFLCRCSLFCSFESFFLAGGGQYGDGRRLRDASGGHCGRRRKSKQG
jgi:hypothetical protein